MVRIEGDIERAIGFKEIEVNGVKIDISDTIAQDIIDFQMLPLKTLPTLNQDKLIPNDLVKFNDATINWFVNYFNKHGVDLEESKLRLFVVKNLSELRKKFTIGFGLRSREDYEKEERDAKKKLDSQE